jgi:NAD(P)-dependent dehydrogenase (short-subunit alcohol dehydrogenase family)
MEFRDKTVVVTGGAQGIGMAVTMAFARSGAWVAIADKDVEAAEELAEVLQAGGQQAYAVAADVADEDDIRTLFEELGLMGRATCDVLVNNAGIMDTKPLADRATEAWDAVLNVNLRAYYLCARHAAPLMPPGSAIVNIASTRALMSEPDTEPYSASKGGVVALTHSLAVSLGDRGIRVNCISPGWIDVSEWRKRANRAEPQLRDIDHRQHPAGRVGRPTDIAHACLFLANEKRAGFITGQNLVVDGGMTIKMIYAE